MLKYLVLLALFSVVFGKDESREVLGSGDPSKPVWPWGTYLRCRFCKWLVNDIQQRLENRGEQVMKSVIKRCNAATHLLRIDCHKLVYWIIPHLGFLLDRLTPEALCEDMKYCEAPPPSTTNTSKSGSALWNHIRQMNEKSLRGNDSRMKWYGAKKLPPSEECKLCKEITRDGQKFINNHTEVLLDILKKSFTDACDQLTGILQSKCNKEVAEVIPAIVLEILRDAIDPGVVCDFIMGCTEEPVQSEIGNSM